jgi:TPR repeat protein
MADARKKAEDDALRQRQLAEAAAKAAEDARRNAAAATPTAKPPAVVSTQPEPKVADATPAPQPVTPPAAPPPAIATPQPPATPSVDSFQLAQNLETDGKGREAVRAYTAAARGGNCEAARRLGQIYDKGIRDVQRDYQESLRWYGQAEKLGCKVERTTGRPV